MNSYLAKISEFETYFHSMYAKTEYTDFGVLFYCDGYKDFYDGNHAVINTYDNIDTTIDYITEFYTNRDITPRIYSPWFSLNNEYVFEVINNKGYSISHYTEDDIMIYNKCNYVNKDEKLNILQIDNIDEEIKEILLLSSNGYEEHLYKRTKLLNNKDSNFFAGYFNNIPVVIGVIEIFNNIARITNIYTHRNYRKRYFATELILYLIKYSESLKFDFLYLETDNPIARNIYSKLGFQVINDDYSFWVAYKN